MNAIDILTVFILSLFKWVYKLPLLLFRAVKLISTQKQWKNQLILTALAPLFIILYPIYKIVVSISLLQNPPISLTENEKDEMRLFFEERTVNKIRLSVGKGLIYKCLAAPDWYAFTVGHIIFYLDDEFDEDKNVVLRHEIIHTLQYKKYGGRFCYLLLYACHLITSVVRHKFDLLRSYEKHPAELEGQSCLSGWYEMMFRVLKPNPNPRCRYDSFIATSTEKELFRVNSRRIWSVCTSWSPKPKEKLPYFHCWI